MSMLMCFLIATCDLNVRGNDPMPMNYVQAVHATLLERMEANSPGHQTPEKVADAYLLLVFTTGVSTTPENVHDAWAVGRRVDRADSPYMVVFGDLDPDVAAWDEPFVRAIQETAATLI